MANIGKLVRQLSGHPKNIRFKELDAAMTKLGYEKRQSGTGGSHYVYSHPNVDALVVFGLSWQE